MGVQWQTEVVEPAAMLQAEFEIPVRGQPLPASGFKDPSVHDSHCRNLLKKTSSQERTRLLFHVYKSDFEPFLTE